MIIVGNGVVITRDDKNTFIKDGAVAIDNNKIMAVGDTDEIKNTYKNSEFIDAKGNLIMPGLINTHHHIYSAFARGLNLNNPPAKNFVDILENLWWKIDKKLTLEDVKYSGYTTLIDCVKNGVTTVFDHHASPYAIENSLFTLADVAKEIGIRGSFCYETSDRDGEAIVDAGIKENIDFIKYASKDTSNMVGAMFGLHAQFTLSDKTLEKCAKEMESLDAGYHVHTAEGIEDLHACLKEHGKRVVERLMDFNILGDKTLSVHNIHINSREMDILKETKTNIVNNPESNMGNAVGCAPVIEMIKRGINVGLGTDGYTSDMFESMKVCNIIHKHNLCDSNVAWSEVPLMFFENNKNIASRHFKTKLGVLEKGATADVIVVEYDPLTPINNSNINSHLLFGVNGKNTLTTIINGKVIMKDRVLLNLNEKEIFRKSREISGKLWSRF
ncbi:MAG: putative aminohydrolase SsnA [Clostridium perfringens]|nr:putative aminohydrolase SsnA [Clostridium perfringens]